MQALVETLFDAVYLVSVITIGIMIRKSSIRSVRMDGSRAGGGRLVPFGAPCACPVYYWSGELHGFFRHWKVDYLSHDDDFLCASLLRLAAEV